MRQEPVHPQTGLNALGLLAGRALSSVTVGSGNRSKVCFSSAFFTVVVVLLGNLNNPSGVMISAVQRSGHSWVISSFRPSSGMKTNSPRPQKLTI